MSVCLPQSRQSWQHVKGDPQKPASRRKAMDPVAEKLGAFVWKTMSSSLCCGSEVCENHPRWGRELRHWQRPVGAFWSSKWEGETVLATLLSMSVWVMVGCCLSELSLLEVAHSVSCFAFPCEKLVWIGGDLNIPLCCWACQAWRCVLFPTRKVRPLGTNLFSKMNPPVCPWCLTDWNSCLCGCAFNGA